LLIALIYTIINSEVQHEILRSIDRYLTRHYSSWEQPNRFRNYINKLDDERLYSFGGYQTRLSIPMQYLPIQSSHLLQQDRSIHQDGYCLNDQSQQDSICTTNAAGQELTRLNSKENN